jgi:hypothetical protein
MTLLLVLAGGACSQIFPATRSDKPKVTSLQPRVQKTAAQRRDGSDVTLPKDGERRGLIGALVPCDPADSAAATPRIATDCQHIDPNGDILKPRADTGKQKRP